MILDLTKLLEVPYIEWIVLGVVALLLIITVIITTLRGIVKCLFDLIYIGGLIAGLLFGIPYISGFISSIYPSPQSITTTLLKMPTCGAARPTPCAFSKVWCISSSSCKMRGVISSTLLHFFLSVSSPSFNMLRIAMSNLLKRCGLNNSRVNVEIDVEPNRL